MDDNSNFGHKFNKIMYNVNRENEAMELLKSINPDDLPEWYEEELPIVLEWIDKHDKKSMAYSKE